MKPKQGDRLKGICPQHDGETEFIYDDGFRNWSCLKCGYETKHPKPTINEAVKDTFKQIYSGNNKKMLDNLGKWDAQLLMKTNESQISRKSDAKGSRDEMGIVDTSRRLKERTLTKNPRLAHPPPTNSEKPAKPAFPLCEKYGIHIFDFKTEEHEKGYTRFRCISTPKVIEQAFSRLEQQKLELNKTISNWSAWGEEQRKRIASLENDVRIEKERVRWANTRIADLEKELKKMEEVKQICKSDCIVAGALNRIINTLEAENSKLANELITTYQGIKELCSPDCPDCKKNMERVAELKKVMPK